MIKVTLDVTNEINTGCLKMSVIKKNHKMQLSTGIERWN